jgi:hypothetical protein
MITAVAYFRRFARFSRLRAINFPKRYKSMPAAPGINTAKKTSPTTEAGNTSIIVNSFNPLLSEIKFSGWIGF